MPYAVIDQTRQGQYFIIFQNSEHEESQINGACWVFLDEVRGLWKCHEIPSLVFFDRSFQSKLKLRSKQKSWKPDILIGNRFPSTVVVMFIVWTSNSVIDHSVNFKYPVQLCFLPYKKAWERLILLSCIGLMIHQYTQAYFLENGLLEPLPKSLLPSLRHDRSTRFNSFNMVFEGFKEKWS